MILNDCVAFETQTRYNKHFANVLLDVVTCKIKHKGFTMHFGECFFLFCIARYHGLKRLSS